MQQMLSPKEIADATVNVGKYKTSKKDHIVFVSAMLAGAFVSLGYTGYLLIAGMLDGSPAGKIIGALAFPMGLMLILIAGADLFTSNVLITMAWFKKEIKGKQVVRNLLTVWIGNLVGALVFVALIYFSGLFSDSDTVKYYIEHVAEKKVHLPLMHLFFRGILCNILVAVTVYMTYAAKNVQGKVLTLVLPIWVFVLTGFEHIVANMFVLPIAMLIGAPINIGQMLYNFIPVTIGNLLGGMIIAFAYFFLFEREESSH